MDRVIDGSQLNDTLNDYLSSSFENSPARANDLQTPVANDNITALHVEPSQLTSKNTSMLLGWRPYLPPGHSILNGVLATARFIPMRHSDGRRGFVYEDTPRSRAMLTRLSSSHAIATQRIRFAPRNQIIASWAKLLGTSLTDFACHNLARSKPHMSAKRTFERFQGSVLLACLSGLIAWAFLANASFVAALNIMFAIFFLSVAMARVLAAMTPPTAQTNAAIRSARLPDDALPPYSVLVPIYDEADMVPHLVRALESLDYPTDRLDIFILAEADDEATLHALQTQDLPDHMAVLKVPVSNPRTKPKALNYALPLTRGTYVTIYDAEDRPEPDQLRKAVAAFAQGSNTAGQPLGCVQAALCITNASDSFFTRHFALEYMALFDVFLPALAQLNLPIPLGGTSNHFLRRALIEAGGWDAYNVTEDADLGIRLARLGYATQMIASTTYEEAPARHKPWLRQRSRWFKGWWQTWLVHMRNPIALLNALGWAGFLALQTVLLGVLISVLLHPFFLGATLWTMARLIIAGFDVSLDVASEVFLMVNAVNFVLGYGAAAAMSIVGAERRGVGGLWTVLATIPIYWLCLSIAGMMALWELIWRPHYWHKTPHGQANQKRNPFHAAGPKGGKPKRGKPKNRKPLHRPLDPTALPVRPVKS